MSIYTVIIKKMSIYTVIINNNIDNNDNDNNRL